MTSMSRNLVTSGSLSQLGVLASVAKAHSLNATVTQSTTPLSTLRIRTQALYTGLYPASKISYVHATITIPTTPLDFDDMSFTQPFPNRMQSIEAQKPTFTPDLAVRLICPDCQDPVPNLVEEYASGDIVCASCGLVLGDRIVDTRSEWRVSSVRAVLPFA